MTEFSSAHHLHLRRSNTISPNNKGWYDPSDCYSSQSSAKNSHYRRSAGTSVDNSILTLDEHNKTFQFNSASPLKRSNGTPKLSKIFLIMIFYAKDYPTSLVQSQEKVDELAPAHPIIHQKYSMEADMLFGWKPKYAIKPPIPLMFSNPMLEEIINVLREEKPENFPELIYQGFLPDNSFYLHQKFSSPKTYPFKFHPDLQSRHANFWKQMNGEVINISRPFIGMKKDVTEDTLCFDSIFEHGNLDTVIRKSMNEYDLFLRVDANTRGHTSWYYFKVSNMQKGQKVKFNILNLSRHDSLYARGLRPYVYSKKLFEEKGIKWEQNGENVSYKQSNITYLDQDFSEYSPKKNYRMSFEYTFPYDNDIVSFALGIPYTYSDLLKYIQSLMEAQKSSQEGIYITSSKLCSSLGGVDVPLLTITDPDESEIPMLKRQYIVFSGRVHPGETNSSWMMQVKFEKKGFN